MNFSEKLNKQRKLNNISQEQLADALGISRQSVSKWETGESYPDMAKIRQICKILNCSFNDIVDDDIICDISDDETKTVNKKNYLEDFLNYVTKTYNMFIHMSFKTKITMIMEMFFIFALLLCVGAMVTAGISAIIDMALRFLEYQIRRTIINIIVSLVIAALTALGLITFFHLFKIRYLDYYVTIEDANVIEQTVEEPIDENKDTSELIKKKNNMIVIRDPKHSSTGFFKGLAKMVVFFLKCLLASIAMPFVLGTVISVAGFVFCLITEGSVFKSMSLVCAGIGILCYLFIHFTYNVIFGRTQPLKLFLIIFLAGLIITGTGSGITASNITSLKTIKNNEGLNLKKDTVILDDFKEGDDLYFYRFADEFEIVYDETVKGLNIELEHYGFTDILLNVESYAVDDSENRYFDIYTYEDDYSIMKILKDDLTKDSLRSDYDFHDITKVKITCNNELAKYLKSLGYHFNSVNIIN